MCEKGGMYMTYSNNKHPMEPDVLPSWFIDNQPSERPVERNLTDEEWDAKRAHILEILGLTNKEIEPK